MRAHTLRNLRPQLYTDCLCVSLMIGRYHRDQTKHPPRAVSVTFKYYRTHTAPTWSAIIMSFNYDWDVIILSYNLVEMHVYHIQCRETNVYDECSFCLNLFNRGFFSYKMTTYLRNYSRTRAVWRFLSLSLPYTKNGQTMRQAKKQITATMMMLLKSETDASSTAYSRVLSANVCDLGLGQPRQFH